MKVIFLDVDGVLNSDEYIDRAKKQEKQGIERDIDVEKIELLKKAIDETGAKVVLSSSWRFTKNEQYLKQLLEKYGVYLEGSTPLIHCERGLEIKQWLANNQNVEDFIILDDEIYPSYDENLLKKLVKISNENGRGLGEGLLISDIEEIVKRLGKVKKEELER